MSDGDGRAALRELAPGVLIIVGLVLGASLGAAVSFTDTFAADSQTVIGAESGLDVTLGRDKQVPGVFASDDTVILQSGNLTSHGPAAVTVDSLNGTFTSVSRLDVSQTGIVIEPEDKPQVAAVAGTADSFEFRVIRAGDDEDGTVDFRYTASGQANVTVEGLEPGRDYQARDLEGTLLDTAGADASGTASFDALNSGAHDVDVQDFDSQAAVINGDASSPNGSRTVDGDSVTLKTEVDDADFPDDTLTVTFFIDGSQVDQQTVSSAGIVDYTVTSLPDAGDRTWSVTVEDQFGNTDTEQFPLLVPSNLSVRDITNQSLIKPATVSVEVLTTGEAITRTTTNGNVSLEGVPVDVPLLISARSNGYRNRSTLLTSLTNQQAAYLTPNNVTVVENEFTLADRTGDFPPADTSLLVQRNLGTGRDYKAVAGSQFGASNRVPVTLIKEEQFRLTLIGPDGDRRVLGGYESNTDGVVTLEVGEVSFDVPVDQDTVAINSSFENRTGARDTEKEAAIRFGFTDPEKQTTDLDVTIHERGNGGNVIFEDTAPGPLGNYSATVMINGSDVEKEWVVDYEFDRDGSTESGSVPVGASRVPLRPLPDFWQSVVSVGALLVVGGLFTTRNVAQGAVVVPALAGVFYLFGWLPALIGAGAIVLSLGVGLSFNYLQSAGGAV
jgi:hypothetical protein